MEKVINKVSKDSNSDYQYWKKQPYSKRLEALEEIRNEYNSWKYGAGRGFQRVYRIVKRK